MNNITTSNISFVSTVESITLSIYETTSNVSSLAAEILGRIAALFLSPAAAIDIAVHTFFIVPTFIYSIGSSIYNWQIDFILPWQHLQRVRNAVTPLFLGSFFGLIHPYAGIVVSEPSDKHAVLGMLSSNSGNHFTTPCSPITSLSIIEDVARNNRYYTDEEGVQREVFSDEHLYAIQSAKVFESSLESLQAQEYIHKITNLTLVIMAAILNRIQDSNMTESGKDIATRLSGVFIPVLTILDMTIALLVQGFFLLTGILQWISGRSVIYTEITYSPLMHVSFLIQNILKAVGNLLGTFVWFVSPQRGFQVSLIPSNFFFRAQEDLLMLQLKVKMYFQSENSRFVLPIIFGNGVCDPLSIPTESMHMTYLIVEKKRGSFNLYWVNRPSILVKNELSKDKVLEQIKTMLVERFPFMEMDRVLHYPVESHPPAFPESAHFASIPPQGGRTNCVVSNAFGMLEALDIIRREEEMTHYRNQAAREALMKAYSFSLYWTKNKLMARTR